MSTAMYSVLGVALMAFLLSAVCASPRERRQTVGFRVIANTTVPCENEPAIRKRSLPLERKTTFTDEQMEEFLQSSGVTLNTRYVARTMEEAHRNFPNLIGIPEKYNDLMRKRLGYDPKYILTVQDILNFMLKYVYTKTDEVHIETEAIVNDDEREEDSEQSHGENERKDSLPINPFPRNAEFLDFPLYFPEEIGISSSPESAGVRPKRNAGDPKKTYNYCLFRGEELNGYLRLCTVCSSTIETEPAVWPDYVNEASCIGLDDACFLIDGIKHGICQQITAAFSVLERQEGVCIIALEDGSHVIADSYLPAEVQVYVGCECAIHKNSFLADYV